MEGSGAIGLGLEYMVNFVVDPAKQLSIAVFKSNNPLNSPTFEKTFEIVQKIKMNFRKLKN